MDLVKIIIIFAIIIGSMVLHELAHGVVAYLLGDTTAKEEGRLTLNPLQHLEPFTSVILPLMLFLAGMPIFGGAKPVPINTRNLKGGAWGMALVGIAGPAVNFLLALIAFLVGHYTGWLYGGGYLGFFMVNMVSANLGFMAFNLLPIPPLDGSRVLYAIAPDGVREVMERMEGSMGLLVVFVLVMVCSTFLSKITSGIVEGVVRFFYFLVGM